MWKDTGGALLGNDRHALAVELGHPERLSVFGSLAAIPTVNVAQRGAWKVIEIRAPGATPQNTEVRWDEPTKRLLVGVWCKRRPAHLKPPLEFPRPELAWYRSFYLPRHNPQYAVVQAVRGVITIRVPSLAADLVTARAPSPLAKVIQLPQRYPARNVARSEQPSRSGRQRAVRWVAVATTVILCLPVLLMTLPLVGFLLVPLLPLIGLSWTLSSTERPNTPTGRPRAPSTRASSVPRELAEAA